MRAVQNIKLSNSPNYGLGVDRTGSECDIKDDIFSFYNPLYNWFGDEKYASLISAVNVNLISEKITQQLEGVHPEGKRIVVPDNTIRHVLSSKFKLFPSFEPTKIIDETVGHIVGFIRHEFQAIKTNQQYSIWTTVLGDDNEHGLRATPPIKTLQRKRNPIMIWNY